MCWKHDATGNPIDRSIPNKCLHEVEFHVDKIAELAGNIITKLIHALCDVNGKER